MVPSRRASAAVGRSKLANLWLNAGHDVIGQ